MKVMFDTNVFNHILDGKILPETIPSNWVVVGTHVQEDELKQTPDQARRSLLLSVFSEWLQIRIPTESAVWDISVWDEAKWSDGTEAIYHALLEELDRRKRKANNIQDALIAEAAIANRLVLVTNDRILRESAERHGAQTTDLRTR